MRLASLFIMRAKSRFLKISCGLFVAPVVKLMALGLAMLSTPSISQTPEEVFNAYFKDWFQVEIIIFERLETSDPDQEAWPKNIELKYPSDVEFLVDPNAPDPADESQLNGKPDPNLESSNSDTQAVADNREFLELLKKSGSNDAFTKKILDALSESEMARLTPKERPYHFLDDTLQQLSDEARRLGRDRKMRLLFHNAWRQPFYSNKHAPALIITGGDLFEDHYELEGSITLYLSRYLHIHTNLWLTQFDANTGNNEEHWRWLPDRPSPLSNSGGSLTGETTLEINNSNLDTNKLGNNTLNSAQLNTAPLTTAQLSNSTTGSLGSFDDIPSLNMGLDSNSTNFDFGNNSSTSYFDDLGNFIEHPYVIRQIVTIRQKRRMRSGELHYIDHPRLGIILRIDPYQPEFNEATSE